MGSPERRGAPTCGSLDFRSRQHRRGRRGVGINPPIVPERDRRAKSAIHVQARRTRGGAGPEARCRRARPGSTPVELPRKATRGPGQRRSRSAGGRCRRLPTAGAHGSWARLAGLPLRLAPLPDLAWGFCLALARLPPPMPGMPGIPGMPPPARICFIIFCASTNRSTSWLTAETSTPAPRAMRARREPLSRVWSARSAGVIDRMIAATRSSSRSSRESSWAFISPMPGSIPSSLVSEPIFFRLIICSRKSSRVKSSPLASLPAMRDGLLGVEGLLGRLDEGEDVTHVEDARGHPVGVERLEVGDLLAHGREQDRLARDGDDRQRGTTAGVAVELGEDDAVDADGLVERDRRLHGVLTDHGVDDEQGLVGLHGVAHALAAASMSSASIARRPAVSTMTTS